MSAVKTMGRRRRDLSTRMAAARADWGCMAVNDGKFFLFLIETFPEMLRMVRYAERARRRAAAIKGIIPRLPAGAPS